MESVFRTFRRAYLRIGMHTAPPGTLLHALHRRLIHIVYSGQLRFASREAMRRSPYGGTPYYDIVRVRRSKQVDGLALIFFMGLGDYLMATPMLETLRLAHPDLLIYAYASSSSDHVNSPLLIHLLRTNPIFDRVFSYRGRPRGNWVDYDFRDALRNIPKNFLILPVVYETVPDVFHRETALLETFGLPVSLPVRGPLLSTEELTENGKALLSSIRERIQTSSARRVVCCHFGARSSGYIYPYADEIVRRLLDENCLVISFLKSDFEDCNLIDVDITKITPNDTIGLLRALKAEELPLYMISVNSLMWPISAGLGIPNLGLHIFEDPCIHQYYYPNIFVITPFHYARVPPSRLFISQWGTYEWTVSKSGIRFSDFNSAFVFDCFLRLLDMTSSGDSGDAAPASRVMKQQRIPPAMPAVGVADTD